MFYKDSVFCETMKFWKNKKKLVETREKLYLNNINDK